MMFEGTIFACVAISVTATLIGIEIIRVIRTHYATKEPPQHCWKLWRRCPQCHYYEHSQEIECHRHYPPTVLEEINGDEQMRVMTLLSYPRIQAHCPSPDSRNEIAAYFQRLEDLTGRDWADAVILAHQSECLESNEQIKDFVNFLREYEDAMDQLVEMRGALLLYLCPDADSMVTRDEEGVDINAEL